MTILVVGSAAIDHFYLVDKLPTPKETLISRSSFSDVGGKGLNQAVAAHRAGAEIVFATALGRDEEGERILAHLKAEGIDTRFVHRHAGQTDESLIFVDEKAENCIVSTANSAANSDIEAPLAALAERSAGDWLVLQGNVERETTEHSLKLARARDMKTMLNPSPIMFSHDGLCPLLDLVIVNEAEAISLGGAVDLRQAAQNLLKAGCPILVITAGKAGILCARPDGTFQIGAPNVKAADSTGAGDVCCGTLAAGLDDGLSLKDALHWAVAAASLSVTRHGSGRAIPSRAEFAELRANLP